MIATLYALVTTFVGFEVMVGRSMGRVADEISAVELVTISFILIVWKFGWYMAAFLVSLTFLLIVTLTIRRHQRLPA